MSPTPSGTDCTRQWFKDNIYSYEYDAIQEENRGQGRDMIFPRQRRLHILGHDFHGKDPVSAWFYYLNVPNEER